MLSAPPLLAKQMEDEMERGVLKKLPVYYAATTLISLLVFPMLVRNPFTAVFMGGDAENNLRQLLQERGILFHNRSQVRKQGIYQLVEDRIEQHFFRTIIIM